MKIKYLGEDITPFGLTNGKVYQVLSVDMDDDRERKQDTYQIVDDSGEDYLYWLGEADVEIVEA